MRLPFVVALIAITPSSFAHAAIDFAWLGYLSGNPFDSYAYGISGDGSTVVGDSIAFRPGWEFVSPEAYRWTAPTGMVRLNESPGQGTQSKSVGASHDGSVIVGTAYNGSRFEAFRWTQDGGMVGLGDLPGGAFNSQAFGVSADGSTVVGYSSGAIYEAFRWTAAGGIEGIGDLPGGSDFSEARAVSADGSIIVGRSGSDNFGGEAFRWTAESGMVGLGRLPGEYVESEAAGISADGTTIVGWSGSFDAGVEAFRWTADGGMQGIGHLNGHTYSHALGVSADGSIIVGVSISADSEEIDQFIWDQANGMRSLTDIVISAGFDLGGRILARANGVSADGRIIIGYGVDWEGRNQAWKLDLGAPVPEPSLWRMTCCGLIACLWQTRGNRRRFRVPMARRREKSCQGKIID